MFYVFRDVGFYCCPKCGCTISNNDSQKAAAAALVSDKDASKVLKLESEHVTTPGDHNIADFPFFGK